MSEMNYDVVLQSQCRSSHSCTDQSSNNNSKVVYTLPKVSFTQEKSSGMC